MHILICDDDAAFGTRMAEYVAAYFAARSILVQTAVCTSAGQALETPELELYQLAFLDVDMPGVNGMVLGRQLKQKCPGLKLVYVSAYLEFALEGYTVNAYRYLLICFLPAAPDRVPVPHPPTRPACHRRSYTCRPEHPDWPLPGTR